MKSDISASLPLSGLRFSKFRLKDPASCLTHFIAMILCQLAAVPLLLLAGRHPEPVYGISVTAFILSMVMLYAASASYHGFDISERVNRVLRKMDHMMIFVMIAGSYTPVCLLVLDQHIGYILLALVWGVAIIGMLIKMFWITCPKWFSSLIYIGMGWLCLIALPQIFHGMTAMQFAWLFTGGVIYTIGGVIYALKLPIFNAKHQAFGSHEIFHLFVMGGSFCHFMLVYLLVL
ncbi:MAG: hemolysin III family protein [Eubacteriales bacterium]|nr:hemolysin III family protein [Eubacteriales bacterium]